MATLKASVWNWYLRDIFRRYRPIWMSAQLLLFAGHACAIGSAYFLFKFFSDFRHDAESGTFALVPTGNAALTLGLGLGLLLGDAFANFLSDRLINRYCRKYETEKLVETLSSYRDMTPGQLMGLPFIADQGAISRITLQDTRIAGYFARQAIRAPFGAFSLVLGFGLLLFAIPLVAGIGGLVAVASFPVAYIVWRRATRVSVDFDEKGRSAGFAKGQALADVAARGTFDQDRIVAPDGPFQNFVRVFEKRFNLLNEMTLISRLTSLFGGLAILGGYAYALYLGETGLPEIVIILLALRFLFTGVQRTASFGVLVARNGHPLQRLARFLMHAEAMNDTDPKGVRPPGPAELTFKVAHRGNGGARTVRITPTTNIMVVGRKPYAKYTISELIESIRAMSEQNNLWLQSATMLYRETGGPANETVGRKRSNAAVVFMPSDMVSGTKANQNAIRILYAERTVVPESLDDIDYLFVWNNGIMSAMNIDDAARRPRIVREALSQSDTYEGRNIVERLNDNMDYLDE